jgi:hypothetical protein
MKWGRHEEEVSPEVAVTRPGQTRLRKIHNMKAPTTLIQDDKELEIFTMRMRVLIVPQCLANGKLSK